MISWTIVVDQLPAWSERLHCQHKRFQRTLFRNYCQKLTCAVALTMLQLLTNLDMSHGADHGRSRNSQTSKDKHVVPVQPGARKYLRFPAIQDEKCTTAANVSIQWMSSTDSYANQSDPMNVIGRDKASGRQHSSGSSQQRVLPIEMIPWALQVVVFCSVLWYYGCHWNNLRKCDAGDAHTCARHSTMLPNLWQIWVEILLWTIALSDSINYMHRWTKHPNRPN